MGINKTEGSVDRAQKKGKVGVEEGGGVGKTKTERVRRRERKERRGREREKGDFGSF